MEGLKKRMMYSFFPFEDVGHIVGGSCIPALEVNDNFLNSAIVTSELLPPIPTTRHTYHLQPGGKEHSSSSKEIPHISSVEENLRDERLLK